MAFLSLLKILTKIQSLRFGLKTSGRSFIHPLSVIKVEKGGLLQAGSDVVFSSNTYVECKRNAQLIINDGCVLNSSSRIQSYNHIELGEKVIVGPFSYLCDFIHNYQDVTKAIKDQGCTSKGQIHIGDGTWIGASVTILSPVNIGKGCVIGANSLVNKDVPDYSVAVGNPARIVKQYDAKSGRWIKV